MNTVHRGILTLVRSALTGEKLALPEGFTLEEADELIRKQSLLPMAYQGAYNCGIPADSEIMIRYQMEYYKKLIHSEEQMQSVGKIFAAFDENGIDYLPLKGSVIKGLYPKPEFRPMGDADILIRNEQYPEICRVMKSAGFREESQTDYDYHWRNPSLMVELHKHLFSQNRTAFSLYFGDAWKRAQLTQGHKYCMTPEDEYVYIFSHMAKHVQLGGIGARQLVDLYVYRRAHASLDEAKIEAVMLQVHALEFYHNINRMLAVWFEEQPTDAVSDFITEFIFSSNNFGSLTNKMYAEEAWRFDKNEVVSNTKLKSTIRTIFPPLQYLQLSYKILNKVPILFPIFWVVRWIDVLINRKKNVGKRFSIIHGMTDDKVAEYDKMMRYMGIDLRNQVQ